MVMRGVGDNKRLSVGSTGSGDEAGGGELIISTKPFLAIEWGVLQVTG